MSFLFADLLSLNRCNWWTAKVQNYNLNVTEVLDSTLKKSFPGIFNFTVGILGLTFNYEMKIVHLLSSK